MRTQTLLLLAALTMCYYFAFVDARRGCNCLWTSSKPVSLQAIRKVEVIAISGHCRQTEIIVTRKNNTKFCIDPNVKWLNSLFATLQKKKMAANPTTAPSDN